MSLRLLSLPCEARALALKQLRAVPARSFWSSTASQAATKPSGPEIYDVVCVGGGPAGLSLLSALRSSKNTAHLKIALIEGQDLDKSQQQYGSITGYSNRCSSLTPGSVKFLTDIGAWQHVNASRVQPYHSMQVWDGVSGSSITFDPQPTRSAPYPGYPPTNTSSTIATMTENANLTSGLFTHLSTLPPIDIHSSTRVENIELGTETEEADLSSWPIVTLSSSKQLAARLLVGADGQNSPVRTFAGIPSRGWDYGRMGVVATMRLSSAPGADARIAYQRFLPTGPVALLPLPGDLASLVWSTTPANAALLKSLPKEDFIAMVNAAFRLLPVDLAYMHTLASGQAEEVAWREPNTSFNHMQVPPKVVDVQDGSVAPFPLKMRHADTYHGQRVALIGDAAHTIHPLAGQGLNQGLGDAAALASHIGKAVNVGWDIGSSWALEGYTAEQWIKNNAMLGVVDKLHKVYSAENGPVVWGRSLGLDLVDKLGGLKGWFMRQAAGGK